MWGMQGCQSQLVCKAMVGTPPHPTHLLQSLDPRDSRKRYTGMTCAAQSQAAGNAHRAPLALAMHDRHAHVQPPEQDLPRVHLLTPLCQAPEPAQLMQGCSSQPELCSCAGEAMAACHGIPQPQSRLCRCADKAMAACHTTHHLCASQVHVTGQAKEEGKMEKASHSCPLPSGAVPASG